MKKNLKANLTWLGLIVGLFLILKGLEISGIMNLYYIQILMGIGISILMDKPVSWPLVLIHQLLSQVCSQLMMASTCLC